MEGNTEFQKPRHGEFKPESQLPNMAETGSSLKRPKDRFNRRVSQEEQKWNFPQLSVDIFFSGHQTYKDMELLPGRFKIADIFIPEGLGWSQENLEMFRAIANGTVPRGVRDTTSNLHSYTHGLFDMVYGSKKPIEYIDVPFNHPLMKEFNRLRSIEFSVEGSFPEFLHNIGDAYRKEAQFQRKREEYMISHLKPRIEELLPLYPSLKQKHSLNVLLSLGAVHTPVYMHLKRSNHYQKVDRSFSVMPSIYSFVEEVKRRCMFGKEVNDELLARVFLEKAFNLVFVETEDPEGLIGKPSFIEEEISTGKFDMLKRKIISQFNFEEAKEMFEQMKQEKDFKQWFESKFAEKGIKLPTSRKELDEFLKS
jgi:hypothetical protein